jgi:small GTP-binding protein
MERTVTDDDGTERVAESYIFKVLVVGQAGVGKTSFVKRYCHGNFSNGYKATIGVDFASKSIKWSESCQVELFMHDLAGQERIRTQIEAYFRETQGAIYVYDIERNDKDNDIEGWKELLDEKCTLRNEPYKPPSILLVNKIDLVDKVDITGLDELVKSRGFIGAFAISAKTGFGVDDAVKVLITHMLRIQRLSTKNIPAIQDMDKIQLSALKEPSNSWCC